LLHARLEILIKRLNSNLLGYEGILGLNLNQLDLVERIVTNYGYSLIHVVIVNVQLKACNRRPDPSGNPGRKARSRSDSESEKIQFKPIIGYCAGIQDITKDVLPMIQTRAAQSEISPFIGLVRNGALRNEVINRRVVWITWAYSPPWRP